MQGNLRITRRRPARWHLRASMLSVTAVALLCAACAAKPAKQAPVETRLPQPATQPAPDDVALVTPETPVQRVSSSQEELDALAELQRQGMVIHFDYDSAQIRAADLPLVAAHARFSTRFSQIPVRLEGHADERGSREYNVGLGERRAQAVRRALELQGVAVSRISTVSYGEERPVASGSGEASWAQNRRVEIRYLP